ncbi:hypothetical protein MKW98_021143 [Papaver atlanticum]|uniref:RING-type domain-containing protein n=1 Tax=Papaver atlanticum TaxID=357466 RepID=A0AAD4XU35_9MAGN|nr:hypothetical protein MKW98_021143 [Papaver atlanticum]
MAARDFKVPKFVLLIIYCISIINICISGILQILGFGKFTDTEEITISHTHPPTESRHSVMASTKLIRKTLPTVKFEDLILTSKTNVHDQNSCAICLCEYEGQDKIKPLMNCCHIFHASCLDSWFISNQTTCPLCRTSLIPIQIDQNDFKECSLSLSTLES